MGTRKYADKPDQTITVLLDQAHKLQEEYRDVLDRRASVRDTLRTLAASGLATKEQSEMIEEAFPMRTVNRKKKDNAAQAA